MDNNLLTSSNLITAFATALLVLVGIVQVVILKSQRRQYQLEVIEKYRTRWKDSLKDWGTIIFIGREFGEYYQAANKNMIEQLSLQTNEVNNHEPTIWALDSARAIFGNLSDICLRILQGQLNIRDVYPILGTGLLRQSLPLRILLDNTYPTYEDKFDKNESHLLLIKEIQTWLIYHDGIRRRCLILIDILWAEAARLEDLPPSDLKSAADAKINSAKKCKTRLKEECKRLNRNKFSLLAFRLSNYLKNSEYRKFYSRIGIDKKRLVKLEKEWEERLLYKYNFK